MRRGTEDGRTDGRTDELKNETQSLHNNGHPFTFDGLNQYQEYKCK